MQNIDTMHPREIVRGLMRGNRAELKLGYSPANAARAALDIRPGVEFEQLNAYAQGFSDGMRRTDRMSSQQDTPGAETDAYCAGYAHGLDENPMLTYPSEQPV